MSDQTVEKDRVGIREPRVVEMVPKIAGLPSERLLLVEGHERVEQGKLLGLLEIDAGQIPPRAVEQNVRAGPDVVKGRDRGGEMARRITSLVLSEPRAQTVPIPTQRVWSRQPLGDAAQPPH